MANVKEGTASDMLGIRQSGAAQDSKLAKLDFQNLLETRVLESAGVKHQIKQASIFDRDDTIRVASTSDSFELSQEEVTAIQDRIMSNTLPTGSSKDPIKIQGKEYQIKAVDDDALVANGPLGTIVASLSATLVLVILTESDDVDPIVTIAKSFVEGMANQAV